MENLDSTSKQMSLVAVRDLESIPHFLWCPVTSCKANKYLASSGELLKVKQRTSRAFAVLQPQEVYVGLDTAQSRTFKFVSRGFCEPLTPEMVPVVAVDPRGPGHTLLSFLF